MPLQSPRDLFVYDLSSMNAVEQSLLQQLPQMEQACKNPQVKQAISNHITDTQRQASRVQECFRLIGAQPMNIRCHAIDCMQQDFQEFMQQSPSQEVIDMFCVGVTDKTEHFEIAGYTGLIEKARLMGESQVVSLLEDNLHEEQRTSQMLEQLDRQLASQVIQRARP